MMLKGKAEFRFIWYVGSVDLAAFRDILKMARISNTRARTNVKYERRLRMAKRQHALAVRRDCIPKMKFLRSIESRVC